MASSNLSKATLGRALMRGAIDGNSRKKKLMASEHPLQVVSFATDLGWMVAVGAGSTIKQLVFGYPSRAAAWNALDGALVEIAQSGNWWPSLVERLREYAAGARVDFRDVTLDLDHLTAFQRRVVKHCRAIAYGKTRSYGELAALSGSARAARAVGNTMAANRFPIIVPCHRVINSDGSIGNYSGLDGQRTKIRLLSMERRESQVAMPSGVGKRRRRTLAHA
jgi:methylated-DNA-[protein]-cysteine S-methyltransferase